MSRKETKTEQFDQFQKMAESFVSSDQLSKLAEQTTKSAKKIADFITNAVSKMDKKQLTFLMPAIAIALSLLAPKEKGEKEDKEKTNLPTPAKTAKAKEGLREIKKKDESKEELHEEGEWRLLKHPKYGVVHVWQPEYKGDPPTEIVVCLHGYSSYFKKNPDHFYKRYGKLKEQFRKSGKKALFIVPQCPTNPGESRQYWNGTKDGRRKMDLLGLIGHVKSKTGAKAKNNITLMGHSGAYTTMASWLHNKEVTNVIMLDSQYGYYDNFEKWAKRSGKKLVVVSSGIQAGSKARSRRFMKRFPGALRFKKVPKVSAKLRSAKVIYIESPYAHGAIVTSRKVIPHVLGYVGDAPELRDKGFDRRRELLLGVSSGTRILKYRPDQDRVKKLCSTLSINESLVPAQDAVSNKYKLKETVNGSFQYARKVARSLGYDIQIFSGYRSYSDQKDIYRRTSQRRKGKYVAAPGTSWHHAGAAVDCSLIDLSTGRKLTSGSPKTNKYKDILEYCMNRAGFVRYSPEFWHFEIGTRGWAKVMQKQGHIKEITDLSRYMYKREGYERYLASRRHRGHKRA